MSEAGEPRAGELVMQPAAPPTRPGPVAQPRGEAAWPIPIGVLCIVFRSFGLLYSLLSAFQLVVVRTMSGMMTDEMGGAPDGSFGAGTMLGVGVAAMEALLATFQVYAGIVLLRRRRRARATLLIYAGADIVLNLLGSLAQYTLTAGLMGSMPRGNIAPPAQLAWIFGVIAAVQAILTFVVRCLWPGFLLIWLLRAAVRDEVRRWP